ncbi:hypothetical protein DICSQDRAFT_141358 [Dichomitus squalens LYAD-421 SS1]|uniref:Uncharacterized protein n=1 Tax=Dichomitus squalens (strain LYAD-421) TaxID=732165 RepID=R7SMT9_DICSQ|nr:uncharacterized protein DICSQDRAFT_141358 [Dichomitus squalens LYAD-421 SS1]EJF56312.1 hypothetical protein DICSQDRAFT_141358 [Dichomitus squalens LYAD-421 SS1]
MSVSTHRIRTIHGQFGSPSRLGFSAHNMEASWNRIPNVNVCGPRARSYDSAPVAPSPRTSPATGPSSSGSTGLGMRVGVPLSVSASGSRPRRTYVSYGVPTASRRAPPPPPVPAERTASALTPSLSVAPILSIPVDIPVIEDPFADTAYNEDAPLVPLSPPPPARTSLGSRSRVSVSTYTVPSSGSSGSMSASDLSTPPGLSSSISAKDTRGRLVANVLLSRTNGRPLGVYLRRRLSGEQQTYVKSGLSQLVAAAA